MRSRGDADRGRAWLVAAVAVAAVLAVPLGAAAGTASAQSSGLTASLNPVRDTIAPGETVQVGVTVKNVGDAQSPAPVFDLGELPAGWTVASWAGTDATYRSSTHEWLWTTLDAGEVKKFTVTLAVSTDVSGEATIAATLTDGDDRRATAQATVTVRGDPVTATASPTPTAQPTTGSSGETAAATPTPADTATATGGDGGRPGLNDVRTAVRSPGFGAAPTAAAVAAVALALLGRRRSRR
ncbi:hypothetical protein [Halobaculum sp. P14]|uniref:hypothetical protein n=1 Tax=Halobaculum sp. P14 TaxID=3421638 RepID=UPI003EBE79F8